MPRAPARCSSCWLGYSSGIIWSPGEVTPRLQEPEVRWKELAASGLEKSTWKSAPYQFTHSCPLDTVCSFPSLFKLCWHLLRKVWINPGYRSSEHSQYSCSWNRRRGNPIARTHTSLGRVQVRLPVRQHPLKCHSWGRLGLGGSSDLPWVFKFIY